MYSFNLHDPSFLPQRGCTLGLQFAPGELLVIAGENGLGKSRLLQRMREALPENTFVEQKSPENFYDRTLGQLKEVVLTLPQKINRLRFERMLTEFGLDQLEERRLSQLSGGESQALKICLALAKDAPIVFLDEPSHFLDTNRKRILSRILNHLRTENKSVVMVEHDWSWLASSYRGVKLIEDKGTLKVGEVWTI